MPQKAKKKRAAKKQARRGGQLVKYDLSVFQDLFTKALAEAANLKENAREGADREYVARAERILRQLNSSRLKMRLCPQSQFRVIRLKEDAGATRVGRTVKQARKTAKRGR